ncbi:MAG: hypothetical protein CMH85_08940 [Novosphingobium sp.]|uniref:HTH crp-type domain-containing protein n=1 Tax=Tsuneonella suprasediminis TaxID=2306996 RepID=A0A419R508_9SPHN|nr:hypothetical protein [Tsuneonella suprasediminis]MAC58388.1 hypothetical protein [Novosphingobium sp.]RJX70342.1 hypothetical protein D6858_02555 [Tsuneonella suprasediminis]
MSSGGTEDGMSQEGITPFLRVLRLILHSFLRQRMAWPGQRPEDMDIAFDIEAMAGTVGLSTGDMAAALDQLTGGGLIFWQNGVLRVMDPDGLVDAARVDPAQLSDWLSN